jgi:hypothetical protein
MGSTFLSSGSPGARLNLALLDSAYFCYVIPCLSITWIFMGAIWVGMKKGRPDCSNLPYALSFRSVVIVWILTSGDY